MLSIKSLRCSLKYYKDFSVLMLLFINLFFNSAYANESHKPFYIITTFTILQDMAQNIAGDKAVVESITKHGAEIHDYQPTPKDIQKIQHADIILYNGLHLEAWFEQFYRDVQHIPKYVLTEGIQPIYVSDMSEQNRDTNIPNPHAWISPKNALIYIENIKKALIDFDPENETYYTQNALNYANKIITLSDQITDKLSSVEGQRRWLVTSEGAFSYLAKDFNLNEAYLYPINAEQQVKPKQLTRIIDMVNRYEIPVIFSEKTTSDRPAKTIVAETQAQYGGVLYVDSLSEPEGPVPTYLALLETTLNTIVDGFALESKK